MNPTAIQHLVAVDPLLARVIDRVGPITLKPRRRPPFQSLVQSIIYQQLSGKAAGTILGRFRALFGNRRFPAPAQVLAMPAEPLRAAGLSQGKARYVRDVAARADAGQLPTLRQCDALTNDELIARLTEIKGVGRWTAEMFLIFNLGRPDVLPVHDLGVRKGFKRVYGKRRLPEPESLERHGKIWRPHRTAAALYLWRALDFPPNTPTTPKPRER